MYSRPSGEKPPSPFSITRPVAMASNGHGSSVPSSVSGAASSPCASSCSGINSACIGAGNSSGMAGATAGRRLTCSARLPRLSLMITRATDWISTRSSCATCCAARTKMPPGRSTTCASMPTAIIPMIWSCNCCRYPAWSSFQITRSTEMPLSRQYACACTIWRTSSMLATSEICTSTTGRSPEIDCPQRPDCPRRFCSRIDDSARSVGCAYSTSPARRSYSCASAWLALICRRTTWLWVHARSNTRSASRRSRYFSMRVSQVSRVGPMPVTMSMVADWPGCNVTRQRIATIGSSTEPCALDNATESVSAVGRRKVLPRPMKRERSVS